MYTRRRPLRLAYFVSHPIQYQAPLLRRIAREPDIDLEVFFSSDHSVRGYVDEGFGVKVEWDVPLLEGYGSAFLPRWLEAGKEPGFWRPLNHSIFRKLEQGGFDAIWSHGYSTANSLRVIASAAMLRIPLLLRAESTLHDRARSRAKLLAKGLFFHALRFKVSAVLAIGEANARYWRHYLGETMPIFHMPYAVDNAFFQRRSAEAAAGREALRSDLALDPGRPVILFASKLQERKRCADLVAAHRQLRQPRPYLLIAGDGEERQRLEQQAADPQAHGEIRFLGFRNQTELPRYFDLCDVFVLPSRHEPWGLVVNEAMNAGRAVIVSDDVGCQQDLVREGETGAVFPAGDVAGLAAALERVLATPETAARIGAAAREYIGKFSFEQDVAGLRQALASCVPGFPTCGATDAAAREDRLPL
ncbi:MAG TPA: glycosyltransferase family 4 protein [Acidobacteriaceae bacterium]|jgi:glycosyltransferase involved in cell wall biosynthesis